jgi:hypothetical protein
MLQILKDSDFEFEIYHKKFKLQKPIYPRKEIAVDTVKDSILLNEEQLIEVCDLLKKGLLNHKYFTNEYSIGESEISYIKKNGGNIRQLSRTRCVLWNFDLINKYKNEFDWSGLSRNSSVLWDFENIEKFSEFIDFESLCYNPSLKICKKLLKEYKNKLDWYAISGHPNSYKSLGPDLLYRTDNIIFKDPSTGAYDFGNEKPQDINGCYSNETLYKSYTQVKPSISTNFGIEWCEVLLKNNIDKIDFWFTTMVSKLYPNVVVDFFDYFGENRLYRYSFWRKSSDERISYKHYENSWGNIFYNPNFKIGLEQLFFLENKKTKIIESHDSDHLPSEAIEVDVLDFLTASSLELPLEQLIVCEQSLRIITNQFVRDNRIEENFFKLIIKPFLLNNPEELKKIIKHFLNIY